MFALRRRSEPTSTRPQARVSCSPHPHRDSPRQRSTSLAFGTTGIGLTVARAQPGGPPRATSTGYERSPARVDTKGFLPPCRAGQEGSPTAAAGQKIFSFSRNRSRFRAFGTQHRYRPTTRGDSRKPGCRVVGVAQAHADNACTRAFSAEAIGIAMKYALIAASIAACTAAFCPASAQGVSERREAPVARPAQVFPQWQSDPRTSQRSEPAVPQTAGRFFTRDAGSDSSAEESRAAAEARRVRAAVGRTLDRTRELSQTASD